jgi:hypothetical protein
VRPAMGCKTFGVVDFIRVPSPAASTTTVSRRDVLTEFSLLGDFV